MRSGLLLQAGFCSILKKRAAQMCTFAAAKNAFKFARRSATILLFSVPKAETTYEVLLFDVYQKELTIKGAFVNSGRIQIAPIITHTFTLDELPEAIAMQMSTEVIKVIVKA